MTRRRSRELEKRKTLVLLNTHKGYLAEELGMTDLALFGATVRNAADSDSDVNISMLLSALEGSREATLTSYRARFLFQRYLDSHHRADIHFALHLDTPAMFLHKSLHIR